MPDEGHAEVLQVVGGQLRQYRGIDRIVAKRSFVLLHTEAVEPGRNVHPHPPAATVPHGLYLIVDDSLCAKKSAVCARRNQRGWSPARVRPRMTRREPWYFL